MTWPRIIGISGTSNLGKSTLAVAIAETLSWPCISTDKLAKHPGRPWSPFGGGEVPAHVAEHYDTHRAPELTDLQIAHFRRIEPLIEEAVDHGLALHPGGIVLEGSAVLPDARAAWMSEAHLTVLVGEADFVEGRIRRESGYSSQAEAARRRIDLFAKRSILYQQRILVGLDSDPRLLPVDGDLPVTRLVEIILARCARAALRGRDSTP